MDNPVMGGGLLHGSAAGILDLEPPIQRHQQNQHQQQQQHLPHYHNHPHQPQQHHHLQMHSLGTNAEYHPSVLFESPEPLSTRGITANAHKGKNFSPSPPTAANHHHHHQNSDDDDDPSFTHEDNNGADDHFNGGGGKKGSPWHRMKWTDEMVRLLITVVAMVGDDGAPPEACDGPGGKRRPGGGGGSIGTALQKKGKWKTVSKLMMERGCQVSPQQCEDKFNDLNKRYKRLNEILGRGTTCDVVENPALLDQMPHVPAKAKEDVRKILSSKHLFYREMCAYHNGQRIPNSHDINLHSCSAPPAIGTPRDDDDDDDDDDNDDDEEEEENGDGGERNVLVDMDGMLQDNAKPVWEQREWCRKRALQLQEERVEIQARAFQLEKRRFKWQRFCSKKDRELERLRLENERMGLENERMALQVRQREADLDLKRCGEVVDNGGFGINRGQ